MELKATWELYASKVIALFLDPWLGMLFWGILLHQDIFSSTGWNLPYLSYQQMFWISLLGKTLFSAPSPTKFKLRE